MGYYFTLFLCDGVAVQIPVPKGKSNTGRYQRDFILMCLKKTKKYHHKRRLLSGFRHGRLPHDNVPSHTFELA